jgi:type IV pilus assembly protein PilA
MNEAATQQTVVTDCLNNGLTLGNGSCVQTSTSSDLTTPGKPEITLGAVGAASTIVATFGNHANTNIKDSTLTWTLDASGAWSCATTVDAKYAPASCPGA